MAKSVKPKTTMKPDEEKLKALILLISELSEGDQYFGSTKLNKLLFFSDFLSYQIYGASISGFSYEKKPEGPMLKNFYALRDKLVEDGVIVVRETDFWGLTQHRTIALKSADISKLSAEEVNLIARVVKQHEDQGATKISAESHEFVGWQIVDMDEEIPYHTALISTRELSEQEWKYPSTQKLELEKLGIDASVLAG